jgi:pyroglutamyl-peptidase
MKLIKIILLIFILFNLIGLSISSVLSIEFDINKINKIEYNSPKTIIITGFESYLNVYNPNPSQLISENLSKLIIDDTIIINITLPVIWGEAVINISKSIEQYNPDIVISIGTGKISNIQIETIGINLKSCKMPDNKGSKILFRRIDQYGPFLRFSSLPIKKIVNEIKLANISVKQSYHAGTFICNEVFYGILNYVDKNDLVIKTGFIHVPLLSIQDPVKGMELEKMIEAVTIAINVCLKEE